MLPTIVSIFLSLGFQPLPTMTYQEVAWSDPCTNPPAITGYPQDWIDELNNLCHKQCEPYTRPPRFIDDCDCIEREAMPDLLNCMAQVRSQYAGEVCDCWIANGRQWSMAYQTCADAAEQRARDLLGDCVDGASATVWAKCCKVWVQPWPLPQTP